MNQSLQSCLRTHGAKLTRPRLAVFRYLQRQHPATTAAIIAHCSPAVDRASIYRTLDLFRTLGIIHDTVSGGRRMVDLTDKLSGHHHHIACTKCHTTRSIADTAVERDLVRVAQRHGFELSDHHLELSGVCADCKN